MKTSTLPKCKITLCGFHPFVKVYSRHFNDPFESCRRQDMFFAKGYFLQIQPQNQVSCRIRWSTKAFVSQNSSLIKLVSSQNIFAPNNLSWFPYDISILFLGRSELALLRTKSFWGTGGEGANEIIFCGCEQGPVHSLLNARSMCSTGSKVLSWFTKGAPKFQVGFCGRHKQIVK